MGFLFRELFDLSDSCLCTYWSLEKVCVYTHMHICMYTHVE